MYTIPKAKAVALRPETLSVDGTATCLWASSAKDGEVETYRRLVLLPT
jgi:hypothetical protein